MNVIVPDATPRSGRLLRLVPLIVVWAAVIAALVVGGAFDGSRIGALAAVVLVVDAAAFTKVSGR